MEKVKAILAYVISLIGGAVVLFALKNEKNTNIHAAQALTMDLAILVLGVILKILPIPFVGYVIGVVFCALKIWGIIKVCISENAELPVVGEIAKSLFAGKIEG